MLVINDVGKLSPGRYRIINDKPVDNRSDLILLVKLICKNERFQEALNKYCLFTFCYDGNGEIEAYFGQASLKIGDEIIIKSKQLKNKPLFSTERTITCWRPKTSSMLLFLDMGYYRSREAYVLLN